jgi:hypothetical protein
MFSNETNKKIYSVAYARVSDPSQIQGTSEENQAMVLKKKASELNAPLWPDGNTFMEVRTGSENSRPVYNELFTKVKKAKKQGINIKYFIIHVIDRFTRGGAVAYANMKADLYEIGVELVDVYGIIQPTQNTLGHLDLEFKWSTFSPSEIGEMIMAIYAKVEKRNILTRMIGGEAIVSRKGYRVRPALDGYVNKRIVYDEAQGKTATIQVPDPERAKYYEALFEFLDNPLISQEEAVAKVNAMGFLSKLKRRWNKEKTKIIGHYGNKPLTLKQAQKSVSYPEYAGVENERWTGAKPMKTPYPGLVSIDRFNRVNARVNKGRVFIKELADSSVEIVNNSHKQPKRRLKNNLEYPYRSIILCPLCQKPRRFKGSAPRGRHGGRYPTYHCSYGHKYFGIAKNVFVKNVESYIESLRLTSPFFDLLEEFLIKKFEQRRNEIKTFKEHVETNTKELETELQAVLTSYESATTDIIRNHLEKRANSLELQIKKSKEQISESDTITKNELHTFLLFVKKIVEHPEIHGQILENNQDLEKQRAYFGLIFKQNPTYSDILSGTPELTHIYLLSKAFRAKPLPKSLWAGQQSIQWNQLAREIKVWLDVNKRFPF